MTNKQSVNGLCEEWYHFKVCGPQIAPSKEAVISYQASQEVFSAMPDVVTTLRAVWCRS